MISVEKSAKTIDMAVDEALRELGAAKNEVKIEVLDSGGKGILGLFGNKPSRVKVTILEKEHSKAVAEEKQPSVKKEEVADNGELGDFVNSVLAKLSDDAVCSISEADGTININVEGSDVGQVIGRRGETLDALQYIFSLVTNNGAGSYKAVRLDVENYRKKREETLIRLARRQADRVMKYRSSIALDCMSSYERRIVHSALAGYGSVYTYSTGADPNRKVIIAYSKERR